MESPRGDDETTAGRKWKRTHMIPTNTPANNQDVNALLAEAADKAIDAEWDPESVVGESEYPAQDAPSNGT